MEHLRLEQEREEAQARERATQRELQALRLQLQEMKERPSQPGSETPNAAFASDEPQQATQEANPFEKDAKEAAGVKDAESNHAGSECSFFTKPMVREDGSGLNTYADGSAVCYGKKMYQCKNRRWVDIGRCDMYADWEKHKAERLESYGR
jgi:hypothetical protein